MWLSCYLLETPNKIVNKTGKKVEQFLAFLGYQVISLDFSQVISLDFSTRIHFRDHSLPKVEVGILYFQNILNSSFPVVRAFNSKNRQFFDLSVRTTLIWYRLILLSFLLWCLGWILRLNYDSTWEWFFILTFFS